MVLRLTMDVVNIDERCLSAEPPNSVTPAGGCTPARQSPKISLPSSATAALSQRSTSSPSVPRKIMSKNQNNTIFPTSFPSNLAELQLFRVLQNASLLVYYDTLLEMGGEDVQYLCDADEHEFLEIMSLVGMAVKPLHVRRLQKSLQEWVSNPFKFKMPLLPGDDYELELSSPRVTSNHGFYSMDSTDSNRTIYSPTPAEVSALPPAATSPGLTLSKRCVSASTYNSDTLSNASAVCRPYSPLDPICPSSSSSPSASTGNMLQHTPCLVEAQIVKLAAAAERLSKHLPNFEPKPHNTKKKVCKELELVISMPENDPRRMDEIRRYAAIYGRFDCKRKPEKPLTLHEVSVNEAAAQICRFAPALLTRRDELFPLARQVVKDSGCYYSKTQLSSMYMSKAVQQEREELSRDSPRPIDGAELPSAKKSKTETNNEGPDHRQEIADDALSMPNSIHTLFQHSKNQAQRDQERSLMDYEDADSRYSYSNSSSPFQKKTDEEDDAEEDKFSPKVQIIAASGDNIIAVANPALAMSPAIIPSLVETRENISVEKK